MKPAPTCSAVQFLAILAMAVFLLVAQTHAQVAGDPQAPRCNDLDAPFNRGTVPLATRFSNQMSFPINPVTGGVFCRLLHP